MSMSPAVQHVEGGPVGAGPSTGPRQLNPAVSGLSPWVAQPIQSTVLDSGYLDPLVAQHQVLGPAPSRAKRRISEVDRLDAQRTQVGFLNQHALENHPFPDAYTPYSWSNSPPTNSTALFPADVPADMMPGPSSLTHRESVVSLHSEKSFLSSSPSLRDDLDRNTLPQQGTSSAVPKPLKKKRCTGQRPRVSDPKDPKAALRLQNQRQSDDKDIEFLYKLFVPTSEGDVPKKDRLGLSTSQSLCLLS
jgi:hypothetical protein